MTDTAGDLPGAPLHVSVTMELGRGNPGMKLVQNSGSNAAWLLPGSALYGCWEGAIAWSRAGMSLILGRLYSSSLYIHYPQASVGKEFGLTCSVLDKHFT